MNIKLGPCTISHSSPVRYIDQQRRRLVRIVLNLETVNRESQALRLECQTLHSIAKPLEKFPRSELICKHEDLSILAPGRRFPALFLQESAPEVGQDTLAQIIYLAAATLDLQVIEEHKLGKNQKKHLNKLKDEVEPVRRMLQDSEL